MKNYEKGCQVFLKWGVVKRYNFSDSFIEDKKEEFNEFVSLWDDIYENTCSTFGGSNIVQNSEDLKTRLVTILDKLFNLNVEIINDWDDTTYQNMEDIKEYILRVEE